MNPILVTPPAGYPVSLAEVRAQLGIETTEHDAQLTGLIAAATEMAEIWTNRSFITRTYMAVMDAWPCNRFGQRMRGVELPRAPLLGVSQVRTFSEADVPTVWDADEYFVDTGSVVGRLVLRSGFSWPAADRGVNGIEITWSAGYGPNPGDVPEVLRLGVMMILAWLWEQRGDEGSPGEPPPAAQALLGPYRLYSM